MSSLYFIGESMLLYFTIGFIYIFALFVHGYMVMDQDITVGDLFGGLILMILWPFVLIMQLYRLAEKYKTTIIIKKREKDEDNY